MNYFQISDENSRFGTATVGFNYYPFYGAEERELRIHYNGNELIINFDLTGNATTGYLRENSNNHRIVSIILNGVTYSSSDKIEVKLNTPFRVLFGYGSERGQQYNYGFQYTYPK